MHVHVLQTALEFDNDPQLIESIFNKINEEIKQSDYHFSHLIIDGHEVYDQFDVYIVNNIATISNIEVVVKTVQEFVQGVLITTDDYIEQALPQIQSLADEFYQGGSEQAWVRLSELTESLQWMTEMVQIIDRSSYQPTYWTQYQQVFSQMKELFSQLEQALEDADLILLADLLQYELMAELETLQKITQSTSDQEGVQHDLS